MSGVNGLLLDGCCCVPIGPCENDIDDFELKDTPLAPWEINKGDWVERFFINNTYINVIANEPYGPKTLCEVSVETDDDCCGGPTGTEICCTYPDFPTACCTPGCDPDVGDCDQFDCECPGCYGGGSHTACDGVQGFLNLGVHVQDLNVDGDGLGVACCDCPGNCGVLQFPTVGGCYNTNGPNPPCPNQDEGYAMLFTGNPTYSYPGNLPRMCVTPCDNATKSTIDPIAFGVWTFSVTGRLGLLYFADGNVTYTKGLDVTECNTMMLVFHGEFEACNSSATRLCAATWGRKFSPASNLYAAGAFVVGRYYKIKVVGTTNFVAIGAASNTIGVVFQATGVGAGTGSAYLARNALELATAYIGSYELRCVQTESRYYTDPTPTQIQEGDAGDHTWTGIELASGYTYDLGACSCHSAPPTLGCQGTSVDGSCGGALSVDYPTCVNVYTDAISQISNLPQPPAYIVLQFA